MFRVDALVLAAIGTGSLMLVNRGMRQFRMPAGTWVWMALAWLLLFVGAMLIGRAMGG